MKKGTTVIDAATLVEHKGGGYPSPFEEPCRDRSKLALGDAGGRPNTASTCPGA